MTCPSCDQRKFFSEQEVQHLVVEQLLLEDQQVTDQVREQRLKICRSCTELNQHTCLKCGCFVRFRASLKNKNCPIQKW